MDKSTYWRALDDGQRDQMAARLKKSRSYLDRVFLYGRKPGAKLAIEIHEATGGRVSPHELRGDLPDGVFRRRPISA